MNNQYIFNFKTDISKIEIPKELNNPFGAYIPEIAKIAASEFQEFITLESKGWEHDFLLQKGKMFGVLVVQQEDNSLCYIGTASGKMPRNSVCHKFIPSIFDDSADDYFINKGMTELTQLGTKINNCKIPSEIASLKEFRKQRSLEIQKQLFENYKILNSQGIILNVIQIFENSSHANPPAAAGECSAPKLLQYAFEHGLKPIAVAEFWWGKMPKNNERKHQNYYPACKDKCRPILEYMLGDETLFEEANRGGGS